MRTTIMLLILSLTTFAWGTGTGPGLSIHLGAGGLYAADESYRSVYGDILLLPHLELAYQMSDAFGLWAGYWGLSKEGRGPVSGVETSSAQHYLSIGGAYLASLSDRVSISLAAGPLLALYHEEAGQDKVDGNTLGADLHATLSWSLSHRLALDVNLGYLLASAENEEGDRFKLGGLWGGLGLAFRF